MRHETGVVSNCKGDPSLSPAPEMLDHYYALCGYHSFTLSLYSLISNFTRASEIFSPFISRFSNFTLPTLRITFGFSTSCFELKQRRGCHRRQLCGTGCARHIGILHRGSVG